ncbi:sugar ABC transporter ATP-binding protein [Rouxiella silvae]|uniref:ABC transporter ATP-binding protein n=1 Tax=Rouxiella silvae TaxID=1646373 RepID=A0AA41BVS6_9GAMM|nr:ABC transporter ATP-binding protein [Rouxiella silvae]MBF6636149.1 ABC transporter ATP-binding protein [Rouxiella silvae]ORJ18900.1 sugar ABC transporter ATP-binding protein [Rouxiella silvae]
MAEIILEGVSKSWGTTQVLQATDLRIDDGEFVAILGPSGCGKSTTLFLLAGLYAPTSGRILFDGQEVNAVDARDRNVGVVFQSYALYPHLSVYDNIGFPLRFTSLDKKQCDSAIRSAAAWVQVDELLARKPAALSGGQQQRVAMARALIKQPSLLLLDEPLSNLDATLRMAMRSELKAIHARSQATTLMVTHDQIEAMTMAQRIICMNKGRVEQIGTPDALYRQPANIFVAGFIGSPPITFLRGQASGYQAQFDRFSLTLSGHYTGPITLGIRPEDVLLVAPGSGHVGGHIMQIDPMGREVLYTLETPLGQIRVLDAGSLARFGIGTMVGMLFNDVTTLLFDAHGSRLATVATAWGPHAFSASPSACKIAG